MHQRETPCHDAKEVPYERGRGCKRDENTAAEERMGILHCQAQSGRKGLSAATYGLLGRSSERPIRNPHLYKPVDMSGGRIHGVSGERVEKNFEAHRQHWYYRRMRDIRVRKETSRSEGL